MMCEGNPKMPIPVQNIGRTVEFDLHIKKAEWCNLRCMEVKRFNGKNIVKMDVELCQYTLFLPFNLHTHHYFAPFLTFDLHIHNYFTQYLPFNWHTPWLTSFDLRILHYFTYTIFTIWPPYTPFDLHMHHYFTPFLPFSLLIHHMHHFMGVK